MNFREHFEQWHKDTYGYISRHTGTAMNIKYDNTYVQARWEAWQAHATWVMVMLNEK